MSRVVWTPEGGWTDDGPEVRVTLDGRGRITSVPVTTCRYFALCDRPAAYLTARGPEPLRGRPTCQRCRDKCIHLGARPEDFTPIDPEETDA